ncbi:TRAP transporter small permease [Thioalkalivibrio sp. HK1]|uniref:TRAP transporter small permease n=1 Tax=Thioalkalivibrio sp. HK1 TaxID=1469245 RepID=UPI000471DAF7|nr:TRAP transporter small permease [Thioalkalivibrio sp. HK1]
MASCVRFFNIALQAIAIVLLMTLALVVVAAVVFRFAGNSLIWYDEVASVLLAWITYYGAALAALKRRHLGFSGLLLRLRPKARRIVFWIGEAVVFITFASLAWAGWYVLRVMAGETLVSLEWIPLQLTQSVVPIGCVLFLLAHALSLPEALARLDAGRSEEEEEIAEEISRAREGLRSQGSASEGMSEGMSEESPGEDRKGDER